MKKKRRKKKESGLIGAKIFIVIHKNCGIMEKEKKTISMNAPKGNVENPGQQEKLSYEQLEQIAGNLNQQCRQMQEHIRSMQNVIAEFNEIGMLLDVLGKSEHFSEKFVARCASKIEELITKAMDASEKQAEEKEN